MKIPCSVPILTLNVKEHLERLLPILREAFDDVFIVDGNSTDGTIEVAQSFGVRVERQVETDEPNVRISDFTAARLRSWSFARHEWMFLIDSDETPTPELLTCIQRLVAANTVHTAYRFRRLVRLPDSRVVTHAFFYPEYTMVRLFNRRSGITLVPGRQVHERFVIPSDVNVVTKDEVLLHAWPNAHAFRKKLDHYVTLEYQDMKGGVIPLLRWALWYQMRSAVGQSFRAVMTWSRGRLRGEIVLPWTYTFPMIAYRFRTMAQGFRMWRARFS